MHIPARSNLTLGSRPRRISTRQRVVQGTDTDALSCKYSAFKAGYLTDPYLELIVSGIKRSSGTSSREQAELTTTFTPKLPLINRGTYVRYKSINNLIDRFIAKSSKAIQILSLGSGSDTRPFDILNNHSNVIYHEFDFEPTVYRKASIIRENKALRAIVKIDDNSATDQPIHTSNYHLHAVDLRTITKSTALFQGLDPDLDTLVLSECCLCYLEPEQSSEVLDWLVAQFSNLAVILYEPMGGNDDFGRVMIQNLASRGISLPTLQRFPTLKSQVERFQEKGFQCQAADVQYIHDNWLTRQDIRRIDQLELLDEREEMALLLRHYCVVWAFKGMDEIWDFPHQTEGE